MSHDVHNGFLTNQNLSIDDTEFIPELISLLLDHVFLKALHLSFGDLDVSECLCMPRKKFFLPFDGLKVFAQEMILKEVVINVGILERLEII